VAQVDVDICPGCARRAINTPSGLCAPCVVERVAELYAERDRFAIQIRLAAWSERTRQPDADVVRLRQQRHRLREAVRPREPAWTTDPWVLGAEAVQLLAHVRRALPSTSTRFDDLERAVELVRRLAWGPDGDAPVPPDIPPRGARAEITGQHERH
jgi:hypothetical protein